MADPTTTNIKLAVPTRGSDVGTWDVPLNGDMTILDGCFGSVTSVSVSSSPVTLSASQLQANVIRFSGAITADITVTISALQKSWTFINATTGSPLVVLNSGGNNLCLPPGIPVQVMSDGTNLYFTNLGIVGSYVDYAGASIPTWITSCTTPPFLACDGSTFSSGTYPALAAILGGTTLPDTRGRGRFNLNGGTSRITTAGSGIDGDTRFSSGGSQSTIIDRTKLPNITLPVTGSVSISNPSNFLAGTGSTPLTSINGGPDGFVFDRFNQSAISLSATFSGGVTQSINGGVSQQSTVLMPPAYIGGITLIRAA